MCLVQDFEVPFEAYPPNIFSVMSYESLMNGSVYERFEIRERVTAAQDCAGYTNEITLQRRDQPALEVPAFLNFEQAENSLVLEARAGGVI